MNKTTKIIIAVVLGIALIAGGWLYIDYKMHCKTYFPNNTVINGIDCSGMTPEMAKKALTKKWNQNAFVVKENGEEIGVIEDMNFTYAIDGKLEELRKRNYDFPLYVLLCKKFEDLTIPMKPAKLTDAFNQQIDALPIYYQEDEIQTEDAYVDMSNHDLKIVPEVYGNNIDKEKSAVSCRISENEAQRRLFRHGRRGLYSRHPPGRTDLRARSVRRW